MATVRYFSLLLPGRAVLAGETPGNGIRRRAVHLLCAIGILAFLVSAISPDDDCLQHDFTRPAAQKLSTIRCVRAAPAKFLIAPTVQPHLHPPTMASATTVASLGIRLGTLAAPPNSIHSPPGLRKRLATSEA
jgi:hypothetical protein